MIANLVVLCSLIVLSTSQYQKSSKDAAILSEARYLAVNGQFGASYKQDDGVEFKEESDDQGNRRGTYSYVDPTGKRRTVTYTAGKDGFRATGDHIPVASAPVPPAPASIPISNSVASGEYNEEDDYQSDSSRYKEPYNNYNYKVPANSQYPSQPRYNPIQFNYQSPSIPSNPSISTYKQIATESSHRFLSPGKFSLNRSPDGYSYTFNNVR